MIRRFRRLRRFLSIYLFVLVLLGCADAPETVEIVVETAVSTPTLAATTTPTELILPTVTPTATAVPAEPTPFPTPTHTAVPTPIVYIIAEGETLLGIAIAQGTTTEAILALNPDLRPEALQIGQAIILPPRETAVSAPQPSSALELPEQINVKQTETYDTPVGGFWIVGEVENVGETAVENVQVEIRFYDAQGNINDTVVSWVANPIVQAGSTAPFSLLLPQKPTYAQLETAVVNGNVLADLGERYIDLQVTGVELNSTEPATQILGTVENVGIETAVSMQLIITFYDEEGKVAGYVVRPVSGELAAGQRVDFTETAVSLGAPIASVDVASFAYTTTAGK